MTTDLGPWTTLVVEEGSQARHGRDVENPSTTLCGAVGVSRTTLTRGIFNGRGDDDCPTCTRLVVHRHH